MSGNFADGLDSRTSVVTADEICERAAASAAITELFGDVTRFIPPSWRGASIFVSDNQMRHLPCRDAIHKRDKLWPLESEAACDLFDKFDIRYARRRAEIFQNTSLVLEVRFLRR